MITLSSYNTLYRNIELLLLKFPDDDNNIFFSDNEKSIEYKYKELEDFLENSIERDNKERNTKTKDFLFKLYHRVFELEVITEEEFYDKLIEKNLLSNLWSTTQTKIKNSNNFSESFLDTMNFLVHVYENRDKIDFIKIENEYGRKSIIKLSDKRFNLFDPYSRAYVPSNFYSSIRSVLGQMIFIQIINDYFNDEDFLNYYKENTTNSLGNELFENMLFFRNNEYLFDNLIKGYECIKEYKVYDFITKFIEELNDDDIFVLNLYFQNNKSLLEEKYKNTYVEEVFNTIKGIITKRNL